MNPAPANLPFWVDALTAALLVVGTIFAILGSLGFVRFSDFYKRIHGPTKATTLGVGSILFASAIHFTARSGSWSLHELLIALFLFLTAPISAHLLIKAALHCARRGDCAAPD